MYRIAAPVAAIVLIGAAMLFAIPANAQLRETSVGGQGALANDDAVPGLTIADVEAALAAIPEDQLTQLRAEVALDRAWQVFVDGGDAEPVHTAFVLSEWLRENVNRPVVPDQ